MRLPFRWAAYLCIFSLPFPPCSFAAQTPQVLKIPDGTALRLSLTESLSSATNNVDDPVYFEITEDVKVGEVIAIPKGSTAVGHVVEVEPRRRMGRAGKLNFTVDHAKAPDGSNVRLRASSTRKGDDKTGTVIVGTVLLSPLFLIMRGKDINIPKGSAFSAYVDGDREISLGKAEPSSAAQSPVQQRSQDQVGEVLIKSTPEGADITVDGKFMGNTPATVRLTPGDHTITIEKASFKTWQRAITVTAGGSLNINPTLEKAP